MAEQKENRSARRSRQLIRKAFDELLKEKNFHKITVVDIVERADLNRSTFYAHYPDIYGIVDEMQEEILWRNMELFRQIRFRDMLKDLEPYLDCIAATMEENLHLMQRLDLTENIQRTSGKLQEIMEDEIMNHSDIPLQARQSALFVIRVHFFMGGIMNAYQHWAEGRLRCTREELSAQISQLIRQSARDFLKTDWTRETGS